MWNYLFIYLVLSKLGGIICDSFWCLLYEKFGVKENREKKKDLKLMTYIYLLIILIFPLECQDYIIWYYMTFSLICLFFIFFYIIHCMPRKRWLFFLAFFPFSLVLFEEPNRAYEKGKHWCTNVWKILLYPGQYDYWRNNPHDRRFEDDGYKEDKTSYSTHIRDSNAESGQNWWRLKREPSNRSDRWSFSCSFIATIHSASYHVKPTHPHIHLTWGR